MQQLNKTETYGDERRKRHPTIGEKLGNPEIA